MTRSFVLSIMLALWLGFAGIAVGQAGGIWPLNDGQNPTEDTLGYNNAGSLRSGVAFQTTDPSPAGGSYLQFSGAASAYVLVNDHSELDITTNLTLEAYVRTSCDTDCTQGIF